MAHPPAPPPLCLQCSVLPLQLLGFDVDPVNSVQFSNHTGYPSWAGEVMSGEQLWRLVEGLEANQLCGHYTHLLTGALGMRDEQRLVRLCVRDASMHKCISAPGPLMLLPAMPCPPASPPPLQATSARCRCCRPL